MAAKIDRKQQKLFGSNAGPTGIGVYGSLAAGSPDYSTDPDDIQSLSNYLDGWYGAVVGDNSPAIEDVNALDYLYAYQLAYILQQGIGEWLATTEYFIGSVVSDGLGSIYLSLTNNNLGNALSSTANWYPMRSSSGAVNGLTQVMAQGVAAVPKLRAQRANGSLAAPSILSAGDVVGELGVFGLSGVSTFREYFRKRVTLTQLSPDVLTEIDDYIPATDGVPQRYRRVETTTDFVGLTTYRAPIIVNDNTTSDPDLGNIDSVLLASVYEGSFDYDFDDGGFGSTQTVNVNYIKINNRITLTVAPAYAQAAVSGPVALSGFAGIPENLRPTVDITGFAQVEDGGLKSLGMIMVQSDGRIFVYKNVNESSSFSGDPTFIGWTRPISITYDMDSTP